MTHEELIVYAQQNDARSKSNTHRIDRLEERQDSLDKLVASVAEMATKQTVMEGDIAEIKSDVKKITSKGAARWDGIVDKMLFSVAAALATYIVMRLGLG